MLPQTIAEAEQYFLCLPPNNDQRILTNELISHKTFRLNELNIFSIFQSGHIGLKIIIRNEIYSMSEHIDNSSQKM